MNPKLFSQIVAFLVFCSLGVAAQPGCRSVFSSFDTCSSDYLNAEFVFVGRVVSVERRGSSDPYEKVTVDIERSIKGDLAGQVELFWHRLDDCEFAEKGKYIFPARRAEKGGVSGIVSFRHSEEISGYAPEVINRLVNEIRSTTERKKQPRVVGSVVQSVRNSPYDAGNDPLNIKLKYDPEYARPLANVIVVAQRGDGKQFEAKTNSQGGYEFAELPIGEYEIYTRLPKENKITPYGDLITTETKKSLLEISDGVCSRRVDFVIQVFGELSGRLLNVGRRFAAQPSFGLIRVSLKSGKTGQSEPIPFAPKSFSVSKGGAEGWADFLIADIPPGQYILYVTPSEDGSKVIYYPGVVNRNEAEIIEVKSDASKKISFRLP